MPLTALLVAVDDDASHVLHHLLEELNIAVHRPADFVEARLRAEHDHFDVFFVDCRDEKSARSFIAGFRNSELNCNSLVVAMVEPLNRVRELLAGGARLVLYKPISRERTTSSIRAIHDLIRGERRVFPRFPVQASTAVDYPGAEAVSTHLLNISKEGIGFRSERELTPCCKVYFQFSLPGNVSVVRLSGEVMWQDSDGRVGLRFAHVPQSSRRVLQEWLQNETTSSAGHSTESQLTGSKIGQHLVPSGSPSTPDRRDPGRKPCRLGADVLATGSAVRQRCILTDVSRGGCYLETTAPLPVGTTLDIVIRTADLKLSLPGVVRKVDPNFGMGVKFATSSDRLKDTINQLVECVAQEAKLT